MNAKEFVKQHFPKARAERHVSGTIRGLQQPYWLIRTAYNESMWFAEGKTESNAWINAKKRILATGQPNPRLQATGLPSADEINSADGHAPEA